MNLSLLKYLEEYVRFNNDPTHQEYRVGGISWGTGKIMVLSDRGPIWVKPDDVAIVPKQDEPWED